MTPQIKKKTSELSLRNFQIIIVFVKHFYGERTLLTVPLFHDYWMARLSLAQGPCSAVLPTVRGCHYAFQKVPRSFVSPCTSGTRSFSVVGSSTAHSHQISFLVPWYVTITIFDNFNNFGHPAKHAIFFVFYVALSSETVQRYVFWGEGGQPVKRFYSPEANLRIGVRKTVVFLLFLRLTISKTQFSHFYDHTVRHPRCVFINYVGLINCRTQLSGGRCVFLLYRYQLHVSALTAIFRLNELTKTCQFIQTEDGHKRRNM